MSKHPVLVPGFPSIEAAAEAVAELRYDKTVEFLVALRKQFEQQAYGDRAAGRSRLASILDQAAVDLNRVTDDMIAAFQLSEPHMRDQM